MKLITLLLLTCSLWGAERYFDGPYLFFKGDQLRIEQYTADTAQKDHVKKSVSDQSFPVTLKLPFDDHSSITLKSKPSVQKKDHFIGVKKIFALGDIHGQFKNFKKLLIHGGVMDDHDRWQFGTGHLVIAGDLFDRGRGVTEGLWLILYLSQQAKKSGGMVHFLIGNHEVMVMQNDARFMHQKYKKVIKISGLQPKQYFGKESYFGAWLRTRNSVIKVNDMIFLHGGLSPKMVTEKYTVSELNKLLREGLNDPDKIKKIARIKTLFTPDGPHWFRGYFKRFYIKKTINSTQMDQILSYFNAKQIIVGHTTSEVITPLFNGKVIGIDGGMKNGGGSGLLWENNLFYTISLKGKKELLFQKGIK